MAHIPRHDQILRIVSRLRTVTVQELTERLEVSEVTIRKDLTILEEMGKIVRTRGGALLAEDRAEMRDIHIRREEHRDEKQRIASRARGFISEEDTIFIDAGTTLTLLALQIVEMNLRVVTDSLDAMNVLADAPGISLISIGGNYRKDAGSFIGATAIETLGDLQIGSCFVGATGFSAAGVFSSQNIIESQMKSKVLEVSKRRIILADSSKFNKDAFSVFARPSDVDIVITDRWIDGMRGLQELGVEVVVAGEAS